MHFIIMNTDKPGQKALRQATRRAQHDYLEGFRDKIKIAGPTVTEKSGVSTGSLIVFEADTFAQAEAFAGNDPYVKAGLFDSRVIKAWNWIVGRPES